MTMTDGEIRAGAPDIVFVTIDCWRHDALQWMPTLRDHVGERGYEQAEAICAAPATRGAFGAIFGGRHYPYVYSGFDEVGSGVRSLAAVLSDAGYATGGFVGSNPFLSAWSDDFDGFWNDRLDVVPDSVIGERVRQAVSTLQHGLNFLRFRGRAPATTVASRARSWYDSQSSPRFLWMHLMDAHVPFFAGWRRALRTGPLPVSRSHWRFNRDPAGLTGADRATLQQCYRDSLGFLDEQLEQVFDLLDEDTLVLLMGDHGEEFEHGKFGHARLYDETVRVPLLTRGVPSVSSGDLVRQIDVGATLLSALGLSVPDGWSGRPHDGDCRDAIMLNHSPQLGNVYTGIRTERYKLVRTADAETGRQVAEEVYDLSADPMERTDLSDDLDCSRLERRLSSFLDDETVRDGLREHPRHGVSAVVEGRLDALGYT